MTAVAQALDTFSQFKNACSSDQPDFGKCQTLLSQLKKHFISFSTFRPGNFEVNETARQEILLARETLEYAILLATKMRDMASFDRHVAQVKSYYYDYGNVIPPSSRQHFILGLNLMRLLAQNKIADFHTELELIPVEEHTNMYIKYPIQLELYIMEGSYNRLKTSRAKVPANEYLVFMDMLMETMRDEIADCSEKAYNNLRFEDAQKLLMFTDPNEFRSYVQKRNWTITEGGIIRFEEDPEKTTALVSTKEAREVIVDVLSYAKEMERII